MLSQAAEGDAALPAGPGPLSWTPEPGSPWARSRRRHVEREAAPTRPAAPSASISRPYPELESRCSTPALSETGSARARTPSTVRRPLPRSWRARLLSLSLSAGPGESRASSMVSPLPCSCHERPPPGRAHLCGRLCSADASFTGSLYAPRQDDAPASLRKSVAGGCIVEAVAGAGTAAAGERLGHKRSGRLASASRASSIRP